MFDVWQNVPSASIGYNRAGFISPVGAFSDGDVSTLAEYDAVDGDCGDGDQSPIVYDADGVLFDGSGIDEDIRHRFCRALRTRTSQGAQS